MRKVLPVLLFLGAGPLAGQSPLVGTWQVTFPGEVRVENGVTTVIPGTGTLTVVAEGDSLIGTLVRDPAADGAARPSARLAGIPGGEKTTFISHSKARFMQNGEESEITVINTWILGASGDRLEGTLERRLDGMDGAGQPARPVSGTRLRG